jgi:predicted nucleotidyltransferase
MNEKTETIMTEFCASLKKVFAGDLLAVVLYGSAAGGGYNADISDINVLVILENSGAAEIFKLGHSAKTLIRKNRISPIILTGQEFITAADAFPLEYSDILETHTILYGDNNILNIKTDKKNLRLQLEEKLRGAAAEIRSMLITAGGNEKLLQKLILEWSSLGPILFRGLLRLKGKNAAGLDAESIFSLVAAEYKVSLAGFSVLNRLRQDKKFRSFKILSIAEMILDPLASLIKTVDDMDR